MGSGSVVLGGVHELLRAVPEQVTKRIDGETLRSRGGGVCGVVSL